MMAGSNNRLIPTLNDLFLLAMMLVIAAILTMAMVLQYRNGEIPCPLCLLQRVAMFGVCFGIVLNFRHGHSGRQTGISLLFALLLLIVAGRQTLLNIYPRPGHSYPGSAVLGVHMPVWSVIIAVAILLAFAIKLAALGDERLRDAPPPLLGKIAGMLSLYVVVLCLINFGSVVAQCGFGACHTFGYRLLGGS